MRVQGTHEELGTSPMKDICIYTRKLGADVLWTLVVGEVRMRELTREDICDMHDQLQAYIRQDGRDDLALRTVAGVFSIPRGRVYSFSMECTSVLSHS